MKLAFLVLPALLLAGCVDYEDPAIAAQYTGQSFANPKVVGILPDGREVSLVWHYDSEDTYNGPKAIYFVSGNGGVTVNDNYQSGKSSYTDTQFIAPPVESEAAQRKAQAEQKLEAAKQLMREAEVLLGQK